MTNYINYAQMSPIQRLAFNKSGYADEEFKMSESEWQDMLESVLSKEVVQKQDYEMEGV